MTTQVCKHEGLPSRALLQMLRRSPVVNLIPLYHALPKMHSTWWTLGSSRRCFSFLVNGDDKVYPFVPDAWLHSESPAAAEALLSAFRQHDAVTPVSFAGHLPVASTGEDLVFVRESKDASFSDPAVMRLSEWPSSLFAASPSLGRLIGRNLPLNGWYFVLVHGGEIVSLLEAGVATSSLLPLTSRTADNRESLCRR